MRTSDAKRAHIAMRQVIRCVRLRRLPLTIAAIRSASVARLRMSNEANAVTAVPPNRVKRLQNAIRSIRRASIATRYAGRIRNAYRKEYEDHHKRKIRELVNGYRSDGLPVPFLSVCDRGTQEIRFTKLLRHFLDPSEPHGLVSRPI